jgi:hypothetical protein
MRLPFAFGILVILAAVVPAQNTGRFAALTSKGLDAIEKGRFNDAINALEEIWEQDQSDPVIAENLGIAYLYADHDVKKAQAYMEASIARGGRASFLMQHAHEKMTALNAEMSDYCTGRLSISPGRLTFTASIASHSFTLVPSDFAEIKSNRWFGKSENVYHIRTADKRTFNLRPRSWNEGETKLVVFFTDKYLKEK